ncbi:MAG: DUF2071 domain-containing protein [Chloroflexota bacterium]
MKVPVVQGVIDRRILINYQIEPDVLAAILPPPFEPQLVNGMGIAGICLIRLKDIRPKFLPSGFGIGSENAAHRIAVRWRENETWREGVYIPRRDTSSRINTLLGGTLFPGLHYQAQFEVDETDDDYQIRLHSNDGNTHLAIHAHLTDDLPTHSVFNSLMDVSDFFERGSLGYSATKQNGYYDGLELRSFNWHVQPLTVDHVTSSFFDDEQLFPPDSIRFDNALLMRGINHEWHEKAALYC